MTTLSADPTQTPLPSAAAQHYLDLGLTPIPFSVHDKGPFKRGWQSHAYNSRDFPTPSNIGLLLGPQGNYLADIDLDSPEAVQLAPHYLPTTNWLSGHNSNPQSHYWYLIDTNSPLPEYHKFDDPRPNYLPKSILELRWGLPDAAHQTVVPPSIHPNREPYVWYPIGTLPDTLPPVVHGGSLTTTVRRLASACLLTRIWKQSHGIRNDLTMALSGALFRAKWDPLNIAQFIQSIAHTARDEEIPKRIETIKATLRRTPQRPTTGWPEVQNLIGKDAANAISGWLALREPLRRAGNAYAKDLPFTDLGNAQRLIDAYGADLIHVSEEKRWYLYTGAYWKPDATQDVHRRANYLVNKLDEDAALQALDPSHDHSHEDRDRDRDGIPLLQKVARRSQSHGKLVAIVARASTLEEVAREPGLFNRDIWALNLENGTLDLHSGELRPHSREDYLTYYLPIHYDPSAECPNWLRFLDQITAGDPEMLAYLQRCVGYSLTGSIDEQCLFILHGPGANGKSVFIQSLADLFGPYAARGTTETFLKQRNASGPMNDLAALSGKRFVQIAEAEAGRNLAEALVKDVTGGEKISARFLYQEFFSFTPTFKLWLSTNHRPLISGTDQAIWRRIKLIPFNVVITPEERVPMADLLKRHAHEAQGMLNWALEGCALWRRTGLRSPAQVDEAVKAYREEMDVIGTWLAERCVIKEHYKTRFGDLYEDYRAWCEGLGEPVPSSRSFSEDLRRHELVRLRSGGTVIFKGVRLHESA